MPAPNPPKSKGQFPHATTFEAAFPLTVPAVAALLKEDEIVLPATEKALERLLDRLLASTTPVEAAEIALLTSELMLLPRSLLTIPVLVAAEE